MNPTDVSEIILAEPRGFCAGVDRAIDIVEHALAKFGAPIYVRHEIVHNTHVVEDLRARGAIFIEDLADVPAGATLVFSAHGVPKAVEHEAEERGFRVFDATCPLVTKVHVEVAKLHKEGYEFIMIGHKGHPEVEGTMGQLPSGIHLVEDADDVQKVQPVQTQKLAVVTQTTLSVDDAAEILAAVQARFPKVRSPKQQDICYAEQLGYRIKLLGITKRAAKGIELRVHPTLIPARRLIANVEGVMNAILVNGDAVGATMYYGAGAGAYPTASAVIADLVDVTRMQTSDPENRVPHLAFQPDQL